MFDEAGIRASIQLLCCVMITNERQYKITRAQAQKFLDAINAYDIVDVIMT